MGNISLVVDKKQIIDGIKRTSQSSINSALHLAGFNIKRQLISTCDALLKNSPEYRSIVGGRLKEELGIPNPEATLDRISDIIRNSIDVSVVPVNSSLQGGMNINILKNGIQEIINIPEGSYKGKSFDVPWLEWLLTQGDRVIIAGYSLKYDISPANRPKTGILTMEKGGGWKIPAQFSGTESDNWITRTFNINKMKVEINKIVQNALIRSFK